MKETDYLHYTMKSGHTWFHYDLQVWIKDGIIQGCKHPNCLDTTKEDQECNQHKYRGKYFMEI